MGYLQIAKLLFPYLIGAVIAGGAAWKIQGIRIDVLKNQITLKNTEILSCQDANDACGETVKKLKSNLQAAEAKCENRLSAKNKVVDRIREIDELKPDPEANEEGKYVEIDRAGGADPILSEPNRVWINTANKQN